MTTALIGGIGNVLLGDDGIGPYVLRILESQYSVGEDVALVDLGTPALDLTHQIAGLHSLILIDCVTSDETPGTIFLYRKSDILQVAPAERLDPHSPALSECLMTSEMLGASPENVLLVGIVGAQYEPAKPLTTAIREAVPHAIGFIVQELQRLGYLVHKKECPDSAEIWWGEPGGLSTGEPLSQ